MRRVIAVAVIGACSLLGRISLAQDLVVDGTTTQLGGIHQYQTVQVINGGRIVVPPFNGSDRINTGNLQLVAESIVVDATSSIIADSAGYQPVRCDDGAGPTPTAGGRGGCSVEDSGGGGAHFGRGGRGTKDCFIIDPDTSCQFPAEFEENCGTRVGSCSSAGPCCLDASPIGSCYNFDALPTVAGQAYTHSIYAIEFGAAGGDKGCRDGDGFSCNVAGAGGGRIVLAALNGSATGGLDIAGRISANGWRGCGQGNDSAGGGAGGSILLVGNQVNVSDGAVVSAAGGLGGDTQGHPDCPTCAQDGGVCDDCGGGGGGGIISVLAGNPAQLSSLSVFNVAGADGGTCTICKGEAGGGAGELQLSGLYVGEYCDGYDNDFDGLVDEGLGDVTCGSGAGCQTTVPLCNTTDPANVFVNDCIPPATTTCQQTLADTKSRFLVILDSSGSMLTNLSGVPTHGDGSTGHLGLDTDGDGEANDSRLYKAKQALTQVIAAYPEIDFGLARFAQDVAANVNCQLAHWFECAGLCCTYDDPTNNSGGTPPAGACTINAGAAGSLVVQPDSPGDECINYAGWCGKPRRGADILVGFGRPLPQRLMWLDNTEGNFVANTTEGDHCNFAGGGDCELRGTGPTPLAGSLHAANAYIAAEQALDRIADCRQYSVILLTDGAETCGGNPATAAAELLSSRSVETFVIGFSVLPQEQSALNQIANAGSTSGTRPAFFVGDQSQLAATLAGIVADSVLFEKCNDLDDDCDELIDEDFPQKGQPCNNGMIGACFRTGQYVCAPGGEGVVCDAPAGTGSEEICNGVDDDCDGAIDEDIPGGCIPCVPSPEICNGLDDDCDGDIDEGFVSTPCGKQEGECMPGNTKCDDGKLICDGGTAPDIEVCDGLDNDCDGIRDGLVQTCYPFDDGCDLQTGVCDGQCRLGTQLCIAEETPPGSGTWEGNWNECAGAVGPTEEICDGIDNDCDGVEDEGAECPGESQCIEGQCTKSCIAGEFVCPAGQVCKNGWCLRDECDPVTCMAKGPSYLCKAGECIDACEEVTCPKYETCVRGGCVDQSCYAKGCPTGQTCVEGACVEDPCDGVECAKGEFCIDGVCLELCQNVSCPSGQTCQIQQGDGKPTTECVDDPCHDVRCDDNYVCKDGKCIVDECSVSCEKDEVCVRGECIKDRCATVHCPRGYACQAGNCVELDAPTREMLATGGGGCACNLDGDSDSSMALSLLLLGSLLLVRRRRRNGLQEIVVGVALCALLLAVGCAQDPLSVPLTDAGEVVQRDADPDMFEPDLLRPDVATDLEPFRKDLSHDACLAQVELCNNVDDNCNDEIDEGFDRLSDPRYCEECAGCAHLITANAVPACQAGKCVISSCAGGYVNLNKQTDDGCEYPCTPTGPEMCDGVDNDCDGDIDEGVTATQNTCKQLGACAGSAPACAGNKGWRCDYAATVELQPCSSDDDCGSGISCENDVCPGVVINQEQRCDGADGDCDGVVDDPWADPTLPTALGQDCSPDPSVQGICRSKGEYLCNAAGDDTECVITTVGQPKKSAEECNGLDDDCDGKVDEVEDDAAGLGVDDDLVHIQRAGLDFYIYAYEASRPDATAAATGVSENRACSRAGVMPWNSVTYTTATAACQAAGMRLCNNNEWRVACEGAAQNPFPYGATYAADSCNGYDKGTNAPLPVGDLATCQSDGGLFDMSGNVREWTADQRGTTSAGKPVYVVRGGAYHTPSEGLTCTFDLSQAVVDVVLPAIGFRCCSNTAP